MPDETVDCVAECLRAFNPDLDRAGAARIFPLWRHYDGLTGEQRTAVLARFPETVTAPRLVRR